MPVSLHGRLIVAISSRALFDLDEGHRIYEQEGVEAYCNYQRQHENAVLEPGSAYGLVKKLLALNAHAPSEPLVEVVLLSRNSADTGLRVFNSMKHHGLDISRAAFCGGESPYRYVSAFGSHLFLSADQQDVRDALVAGYAAATILPKSNQGGDRDELRIAFDGDAVLFDDSAERVYQEQGLEVFEEVEQSAAGVPLEGGPFKGFLSALNRIQKQFSGDVSPIRTALVTARGAPAHERVIRTLRAWDIRIDEALFLGGVDKGEFLSAFGADIFFDDQQGHCESAREFVATGHVPNGIANE